MSWATMESTSILSWEKKSLISELIRGLEIAKQLKVQIGTESSPAPASSSSSTAAETSEILVQQIVSSYEKALLMLKWTGPPFVQAPPPPPPPPQPPAAVPRVNSGGIPESPASIDGSPRSEEFLDVGVKDHNLQDYGCGSKKRKLLPRWTEQVRISPERGLEGPHDDGYSWRKYGQKDILGAKYPRSYYRCTYRNTQNCWATKQVQRSDGDPTVFEVTYRGKHTCLQVIPPPPASPEKRETKPKPERNYQKDVTARESYQKDLLDDLRGNLTVQTEGLDGDAFSFPATSFYSCHTGNNDFGGGFCHVACSEPSDFPGLISANTSTGSSPIFDVDFPIDPMVEIETCFPFDNPMFFT